MTQGIIETEVSRQLEADADLFLLDPRLELVERIASTPAFQKAVKLQALLRFIVGQSICNPGDEIPEQRIGLEVFEKGANYSPLLDSSVRVQARQLRLKLHEYFDGPGRDESLILEIPKGSYKPVFRTGASKILQFSAEMPQSSTLEPSQAVHEASAQNAKLARWPYISLIAVLVLVTLAGIFFWLRPKNAPWPLSSVLNRSENTELVLADSAYQIVATASGKPLTLNEYRRTEPRYDTPINPADTAESRLHHALNGGTFTSFSDVAIVQAVSSVAARNDLKLDVKSARDVDPRDFDHGNFIISGSPSSNPWASMYLSRLNFHESPDPAHLGSNLFMNVHPINGEPATFAGTSSDDSVRIDYVDLAIVPGIRDHGRVMLIQGLRHEGTEAVARMLSDPNTAALLGTAFRKKGFEQKPLYFEAILAVQAIAGIPQVMSVAAVRVGIK